MLLRYLVLISFFFSQIEAESTDKEVRHVHLSECVALALEAHPLTQRAWWKAKKAASSLGIVKSQFYPQLSLEADLKHGRDFKFLNGPDTTYTLAGASLAFSFLVCDFGALQAETRAAELTLEAAHWEADWKMQQVIFEVLENGYAILEAQEAVSAAQASVEDAWHIVESASALHEAGLRPISDLYTGRALLAEMQMRLIQQKKLLACAYGKLSSNLGFSLEERGYQLTPIEAIPSFQDSRMQGLLALAASKRADWMAQRTRQEEARWAQKQTEASNRPKVSIFGNGGAHHALHDKAHGAQYAVGVGLQWSLFAGFEPYYRKRQALEQLHLTEAETVQLEREIEFEIFTGLRSLEASQEMFQEAKTLVSCSLQAFEANREKYQAGVERMSELSSAQKRLAEARLTLSHVKTEWLTAAARLAYATGVLSFPYIEDACKKPRSF